MHITYRETSALAGRDWHVLEINNEAHAEAAIRRVCEKIPAIFRSEPFELLVPVAKRDVGAVELLSGSFLYVRGSLKLLAKLKTVTSCLGLSTKGDSVRVNQAIAVPDEFVQELIVKTRAAHDSWSAGIVCGSFVRVLDSPWRGFAGHVEKINGKRCTVVVEMLTKKIAIDTPTANLLNLDYVPKNRRVFYYCGWVKDLDDAKIISCDLHTKALAQPDPEPEFGYKYDPARDRRRRITFTVRALAQKGKSPADILLGVIQGIRNGEITTLPKNLHIIYSTIKNIWMESQGKKNWWWWKSRKGAGMISFSDVVQSAKKAGLTIPAFTPENELVKDGRSRKPKHGIPQ